MTRYTRVSDEPEFIEVNYKDIYDMQCEKSREMGKTWYKGTGIPPSDHPLHDRINMGGCANCGNENILVIAATWSVHPMNGDVYWDYEVSCERCGKYTQCSYSEND